MRRQSIQSTLLSWTHLTALGTDLTPELISDGSEILIDTGSGLDSYSARDGSLQWRSPEVTGPLAVADRKLFCFNQLQQRLVELNPKNGHVLWLSQRIQGKIFVTGDPERERLLANGHSLALFNGTFHFADLRTGSVVGVENQGDGVEQLFYPASAKQVGPGLLVHEAVGGGRLTELIAEYDQNTGKLTWQSPSEATAFWMHDKTVIVQDANFTVPAYSYEPVTLSSFDLPLQGFRTNEQGEQSAKVVYAPDPPQKPTEETTAPSEPVYIEWPNLMILIGSKLYSYDLRRSPRDQHPSRLDNVEIVLGMLANGALVVASDTQLRFVSFRGDKAFVTAIDRHVTSDNAAFPKIFELGQGAAISDASGTLLIFDGGSVVSDVGKHCPHLVSATAVGPTAIAVLCADSTTLRLSLFHTRVMRINH